MSDLQTINPLVPLPPSSDGSHRPAPRNTYGRRAGATATDQPSFFSSSDSAAQKEPEPSPDSKLLRQLMGNREGWKSNGYLSRFDASSDAPSEAEGTEYIPSDAEVKEYNKKLREAKAKAPSATRMAAAPLVKSTLKPLTAAENKRAVFGGSSSLTDIPDPASQTIEPLLPIPAQHPPLQSPGTTPQATHLRAQAPNPFADLIEPSPGRFTPSRSSSKTPQPTVTRVRTQQPTPPPSSPPTLRSSPDVLARPKHIPSDAPSLTTDEDESFRIRKSGQVKSTARRRILDTSDDEDETVPRRSVEDSPSPSPRRVPPSALFSPQSATAASRSPTPHSDSDPDSEDGGAATSPIRRRQLPASPGTVELDEVVPDEPPMDRAARALAEIFASDDAEAAEAASAEMERADSTTSAESIKDVSFDDRDENTMRSSSHVKAPTKRDQEQTRRDIERARRERNSSFTRPVGKVAPVTGYLNFIVEAVKVLDRPKEERSTAKPLSLITHHKVPNVGRAKQPAQPIQHTASQNEEITAFPSSREKAKAPSATLVETRWLLSSPPAPQLEQSPLPARPTPEPFKPATEWSKYDSGEDEEPDVSKTLAELLAESREEQEAEQVAERTRVEREEAERVEAERKKAEEQRSEAEKEQGKANLKERKAAALAERKAAPKAQPVDDDDDFDIVDEPKTSAQPLASRRKGPDARAVFDRNPNLVPAKTRNQQRIMRLSGKSGLAKTEVTTESYMTHAATTFQHSGEHAANGGSKPVGQKAGRDRTCSKNQLDENLYAGHVVQAQTVRKMKQERYGSGRNLPDVQSVDYIELAEQSMKKTADGRAEGDVDEDDEDPEDEDFALSDEEDVREKGSGDEAEDEAEVEATDVDEEMESDLKSPIPSKVLLAAEGEDEDDEEENVRIARPRKIRPRPRKVAFASDDEDMSPKVAAHKGAVDVRVPLAELAPGGFGNDLNFDGFGDDDMDGGGFSQLFEPTLANGGASQADATKDVFAGMRPDPMALLNAHAVLPKNIISETQAQRDDALVAAEIEDAMEAPRVRTQAKPQYLNDAGFFTQTKPSSQYPTQGRLDLAGSSSDILSFQPQTAYIPNSDQFDHQPSDVDNMADDVVRTEISDRGSEADRTSPSGTSPTQSSAPRLKCLRRRGSDDPVESHVLEPTQLSVTTSPPPRNAMQELMANSWRPPAPKPGAVKPSKSRLVEEQAEESDEDDGWAPIGGGGGGEGEDDEGDGDDAFLAELVDDKIVDPEEKRKQDELAEEKRREIEKEDDAKREQDARKVTEGQYRIKRKGMDMDLSSDDELENEGGRRRFSKQQKRARRMERAGGFNGLPGETNAMKEQYEDHDDSDPEEDVDDEEETLVMNRSPESKLSNKQMQERLRKAGEINRNPELLDKLNAEIGMADHDEDMDDFTISRARLKENLPNADDDTSSYRATIRDGDSARYAAYVSEESQANRRGVGVTSSASVVRSIPASKLSKNDQKHAARKSGGGSSGRAGGSVTTKLLATKTKSFAS